MRWALIVLGVIAALVGAVFIIGALLPKSHVASRTARYAQSPETVWEAITRVEEFTAWRPGLSKVERLADKNGMPVWRETSDFGVMTLETIEWDPPRRMAARIADEGLPFGGTWTYDIAPVEGGCDLTITERGEVRPALFRFMSRFIFGHSKTISEYLRALGGKFGEDVTVRPPTEAPDGSR